MGRLNSGTGFEPSTGDQLLDDSTPTGLNPKSLKYWVHSGIGLPFFGHAQSAMEHSVLQES
jgi:hypothetical protein